MVDTGPNTSFNNPDNSYLQSEMQDEAQFNQQDVFEHLLLDA